MGFRLVSPARLVALALALVGLAGCKVLGMRTIPTAMLEESYEKPNSRYLEVDGVAMHYTVEGKGPPVLLLHGELSSLHTWDAWVPLLAESFTVVRVDIPGFGLSESFKEDDDYTPEHLIEYLDKARKKLGYDKLHVVGNAFGGFIAWNYAAKYPEHVDRLILIGPQGYPQDVPFIIGLGSNSLFGAMARLSTPRFIVKRNLRKVYGHPDAVADATVDRYHDLLLREGHKRAMTRYCRLIAKYAESDELVSRIPEIKAKTLLMWGEKDTWTPPELADRWQQDLPELEVKTYTEGGHFPVEELGEETARDAYAFLADGAEPPTHDDEDEDDNGDEESAQDAEAKSPSNAPTKSVARPADDEESAGGDASEAPPSAKPDIGWDDEE